MEEKILKNYLEDGLTTREIGRKVGKHESTVSYWINKYNLNESAKYKKPQYNDVNYFNKIDTKEKAYILGFALGDGCLNNKSLSIRIALKDIEILEFIQSELNCNIQTSNTLNKKKRIFPHASVKIGNKALVKDLNRLFGGQLKEDRHIPFISPKLERYLLQGFFDAEGCITWGRRKDRNRIWQKISFTSQYRMLEGIQNILYKNGIATKLKPKSNDNCYIIEFTAKDSVLKFLDIIYPNDNFIVLNRKYKNAQALRLELGEFGEA